MLSDIISTSLIAPGIYLGSQFAVRDAEELDKMGITHIVQVTHFKEGVHRDQFQYFVITVQDRPATNLIQYFNDTFTFIEDCISQGGNVLVHCMAGISRSATIVIAYLMRKHQWTTLAAMETVRSSRKIIRPNFGFCRQLELYERLEWTVDITSPLYQECLDWCERPDNNSHVDFRERRQTEKQVATLVSSYDSKTERLVLDDDADEDIVFDVEKANDKMMADEA